MILFSTIQNYIKEMPSFLLMMRMPYEKILEKIREKTGLSNDDIEKRVQEKMRLLSGLISKEGAGHIVANECGINLFEQPKNGIKVKDVLVGMRSLAVAGRVCQKFPVTEFATESRRGKIGSFILGDETGMLRVVLWNNKTDKLEEIKEGDVVKIEGAYVRDNNGRTEAHLGELGILIPNPEGIEIKEVKGLKGGASERKKIAELTEKDQSIEILGTIVQVYNPNFFEICPSCGKRAKLQDGSFVCTEHSKVNPDFSYVCNIFLDDGSESIRCVFFREQSEQLMKKSRKELLEYRENPNRFDEIKTELLGNMVKLHGRVVKNQMFDRIEFIASAVSEANPEEELKRLEAGQEKE